MANAQPITEQEVNDFNAIDDEALKEDRICITRNHETKEISWRFGTQEMSPFELMQWTMFHAMMGYSGYRARIEALEKKVTELEKRLGA